MSSSAMPLTTRDAEERRDEDLVVDRDVGRAGGQGQRVAVGHLRRPGREVASAELAPEASIFRLVAALHRHQTVHRVQTLERVASVEHAAVVHLSQITLDVRAGQRRTTEDHGDLGKAALVQLFEVLAHDDRALHEQTAHTDGVGTDRRGLLDHLGDADLDADVVDLVAVVREDDVDEVLADVVHVALHRRQHDTALRRTGAVVGPVHVRFEVRDRTLHRLGRLQHERQLHLAGAEQLADDLHAFEQHVVDDRQRRQPGGHGAVEVGLEAGLVAVDDALRQQALDRPVAAVFLLDRLRAYVLEQRQQGD